MQGLFLLFLLACATPHFDPAMALIAGIVFSLLLGNPWPKETARGSKLLLQLSVAGLGFSLSLADVFYTGRSSLVYTVVGISLTLLAGIWLGRLCRVEATTSVLVTFGTAICGGSAIAAMAPVLKARNEQIAVALATVFTLNAVALILFPFIGHLLNLEPDTFGIWAGLAIHDTSSVVGATSLYGAQSLAIGTTVKLTRAIWISPLVLAAGWLRKSEPKGRIPLFIVGFLLAAGARMLWPQHVALWHDVTAVARQSLVVTLFLVGSGLSREVLRQVGVRPLLQGGLLWLLVSSVTLLALMQLGPS